MDKTSGTRKRMAFTLCSNNYLAHAKTLGDSLRETNPDMQFIIGLTDKLSPEIDYSFFAPFEILPYDRLNVPFFDDMVVKYNIIEFNTAVKPFYFEYLFKGNEDAIIYYLDPDLFAYGSFGEMHALLDEHNFLLTPHITKPELEVTRFETLILKVGIYNLGFIGMRYNDNTALFLKWWQSRLKDYCYIDYTQGLFVDQVWVNFIHLLFEKPFMLRSPGYNMAYWNFYDRKLIRENERYYVNTNAYPLIFFHFSGFHPGTPERYTRDRQGQFTADTRPDAATLFRDYAGRLKNNRYDQLSKVAPLLNFKPRKIKWTTRQRVGKFVRRKVDTLVKFLFNV
jgi:hypothetical protein